MYKKIICIACAVLSPIASVTAGEEAEKNEPRVVSGMSIVGNDETPKSLYIVPWMNSGNGEEGKASSGMMDDELIPVDKSEFIRELDLYRQNNSNQAEVSN